MRAPHLSLIKFWVPTESSLREASLYEATISLMTALGGLLATDRQATISLELIARDGEVSYLLAIPADWEAEVIHHLYAAYPGALAEPLAEWALFDRPGELAGAKLMFAPPRAVIRSQGFDTDPIKPTLELLGSLPADHRLMLQLTLATNAKPSLLGRIASDVGAGLGQEVRRTLLGQSPQLNEPSGPESDKSKAAPFRANLRLLALAPTHAAATETVRRAVGTLHQLAVPGESRLRSHTPKRLESWLRQPLWRQFDPHSAFWLTAEEAANLYHPPARPQDQPALGRLQSRQLPPPEYPYEADSLFLGHSLYRGQRRPVHLAASDRLRHTYIIGSTGTGKSTLMQAAILQDMIAGEGCCFIDPHGEVIDWLLPRIPPHRLNDVVLFDPSDPAALLGLNLLEWRTPHERDLLIQELILLFYKLFDPERTGVIGPQFEHWLRSAALTITEPTIRGTLVDIPRLFTDPGFAKAALSRAEHHAVKDFWHGQMAQTANFHKSEMLNYFTSKFGSFIGNTVMHHILSQRSSAFDMRTLMDRRKILLVNLSKGKLGSQNAALLGTLIMAKIQLAALSRADVPPSHRPPFYVYLDEFQNVATDSFATMLSEIRKYGVGLHLAHQYVDQLPPSLRQAVSGNVGTMIAFRIGRTDADWLAPHFAPLTADDLTDVEPYRYHIRSLVGGQLTKPFTTLAPTVTLEPQPAIEHAIRDRVRQYVLSVN